jgi:hypothetical protein
MPTLQQCENDALVVFQAFFAQYFATMMESLPEFLIATVVGQLDVYSTATRHYRQKKAVHQSTFHTAPPQRINIAAAINTQAIGLFRRHIFRGAKGLQGARNFGIGAVVKMPKLNNT